MKWFSVGSLVFACFFLTVQCNVDNNSTLLDIAREYRYGTPNVALNLQRASHHYEFVIEEGEGKVLGEALFELSELLDVNPTLSKKHNPFDLLVRAADEGHQRAQHMLSIMYATGVGHSSLIPMDSSRSLLLEYMSALSGDVEAAMGMGYRLLNGIGVTASCELALPFYELSANHAAEFFETEGMVPFVDRMKLSDALDPSAKWLKQDATLELVDYYANLAENHDQMAALTLGNIYSQGTRLIPRDEDKAIYFYNLAVTGGSSSTPSSTAKIHPSVTSASGQLGYLLAKRYTRLTRSRKNDNLLLSESGEVEVQEEEATTTSESGDNTENSSESTTTTTSDGITITTSTTTTTTTETTSTAISTTRVKNTKKMDTPSPVTQTNSHLLSRDPNLNVTRIYDLLSFAALRNDPHGGIGMGYLHMRGIGVPSSLVNYTTAMDYFRRFINTHSDAGYYLGEIHMGDNGRNHADINLNNAVQAYTISAQQGNMLAIHRMAQLSQRGMGVVRSCTEAVHNFRLVSERGPWSSSLSRAHKAYSEGRKQESLYLFSQMAALGIEVAQYNAAYILSKLHCPAMHVKSTGSGGVVKGGDGKNKGAHRVKVETEVEVEGSDEDMSNKIAYLSPSQWQVAANDDISQSTSNNNSTSISTYTPSSTTSSLRHIQCEQRALLLFALSASQGNAESFLLLGDFYYYGQAGLPSSHIEAAVYYQRAADLKHTQAIFNLGIMHEVGDGVSYDLHLAKRYYDQAAETDVKAAQVRNIALVVLDTHRYLDHLLSQDYTTLNLMLEGVGLGSVQEVGRYFKEAFNTIIYYDAQLRSFLDEVIASRLEQFTSLKTLLTRHYDESVDKLKVALHYDEVVAKWRSLMPSVATSNNNKFEDYFTQSAPTTSHNKHNKNPRKKSTTTGGSTSTRSKQGGGEGSGDTLSEQDLIDEELDYLILSVLVFVFMVLLFVKYYRNLKRRAAQRRLDHHNLHHNANN